MEINKEWLCPNCIVACNSDQLSEKLHQEVPLTNANLTSVSDTSTHDARQFVAEGNSIGISCMLLNARSLVNKRSEFKAMLMYKQPRVVAVIETFLERGNIEFRSRYSVLQYLPA